MSRQLSFRVCIGIKLRVEVAEVPVRDHLLLPAGTVGHISDRPLGYLSIRASVTDKNSSVMTVRKCKLRDWHARQIAVYAAH